MAGISSHPSSISIHSLARRLTSVTADCFKSIDISIHSLARRLTATNANKLVIDAFQFTASQGG